FGMQLLNQAARNNPGIAPVVLPIIILYAIFAIMTWLASPLFNLMLRLSRFGRLALSREETLGANLVGLDLLIAVGFAAGFIATGALVCIEGAVVFGLLCIPVSSIFKMPRGWPRWTMAGITAALAIMGTAQCIMLARVAGLGSSVPQSFGGGEMLQNYAYGVLISSLLANGLAMAR